MHHDPMRHPPERKISTQNLLEGAVRTLWQHADPGDSGYERGVVGLVAHLIFDGDWTAAQTAIGDERERIEQDIADEIERAEEAVKRAEDRLSEARSKKILKAKERKIR